MLDFLPAGVATILVAALVAAAVAFIIVRMVKGRKRGSGSCGSACAGCPNAGTCCHCSRSTKDR